MMKVLQLGVVLEHHQILHNISLDIRQGSFTCIVGKNGSGKSTLLKAMNQYLLYTGTIMLESKNITQISKEERARMMCYLPQQRSIPNMNVEQLISHGRYPHLGFSKTLQPQDVKLIQLAAKEAGVENLLHRNLTSLSGGERQRAYIAMMIAQDTDYILLDEPTTFLDVEYQLDVMDLLHKLNRQGKTIIMVAHDLPQAFTYASDIVLMDQGRIISHSKPDELIQTDEIYRCFGVHVRLSQNPNDLYRYTFER